MALVNTLFDLNNFFWSNRIRPSTSNNTKATDPSMKFGYNEPGSGIVTWVGQTQPYLQIQEGTSFS